MDFRQKLEPLEAAASPAPTLSLLSISLDRREETRGLLLLPSVAPRPKPEKCLTLDT